MTLRPRLVTRTVVRGRLRRERLAFIERELLRLPKELRLGGPHDTGCNCFACVNERARGAQLIEKLLAEFQRIKEQKEIQMPHYADGTEAKVGDQVTGKLYNSEGIKAGVIISITPGQESCNAQVQFTEMVPLDPPEACKEPRMAVRTPGQSPSTANTAFQRRVLSEQHGSAGPEFLAYTCADYCATNQLTKVG